MKKPEDSTAQKFLKMLDGTTDVFTFQCFHPDRKKPPTKIMHGTFEDWQKSLRQYNKDGYGVYVTINKTDGEGRKISNIKKIRAVWQEDDGDGTVLPIKPSIVVNTSPGKHHRYVLVRDGDDISKDEFDEVQKKIVSQYGGDKNARDITRVLRVPGFYNTKKKFLEGGSAGFLVDLVEIESSRKSKNWSKIQKKFLNGNRNANIVLPDGAERISVNHENFSDDDAIEEISESKNYYEPMLSWSMHLANKGLPEDAIVGILEAALKLGRKKRPEQDLDIWQERFEGIQQMVSSAISKVIDEGSRTDLTYLDLCNAVVSADQMLSEDIDPVKYLIEPIVTDASVNMVHAARGLGKTFFCLSIGAAVAAGVSFLKYDKIVEKRVLYIDGELPYSRLKDQLETSCRGIGIGGSRALAGNMDLLTGDKFPNKVFPDLTSGMNQKMVDKLIRENNYGLVIIDNIATVFKSGEGRQEDWKEVQTWLISMRTRGTSTLLVHHDNKAGDAQRGFSNKEDIMDTVLHLVKARNRVDEDGAKFNVTFSKGRYLQGKDRMTFGVELLEAGWMCKESFGSNYEMTVELFKQGFSAIEITRKLQISKVQVSKYKKKAIDATELKVEDISYAYKQKGERAQDESEKSFDSAIKKAKDAVDSDIKKLAESAKPENSKPKKKKAGKKSGKNNKKK